MTATPTPTITFRSVHPVLSVRDLEKELAYYRDKLDIPVLWRWGSPSVRAGVSRDGLEIQLVADGRFAPAHPSNVYFVIRGVDQYYQSCVERGAEILTPVGDRPFGMRDFRLIDLSGNALGFGEPLPGRT